MSAHETISERAYQIWRDRGQAHGSDAEDWLEAERQLSGESSGREGSGSYDSTVQASFPASDPPASALPDDPPANAGEQWATARQRKNVKSSGAKPSDVRCGENSAHAVTQDIGGVAPPVDETDDAPASAPKDIGEG